VYWFVAWAVNSSCSDALRHAYMILALLFFFSWWLGLLLVAFWYDTCIILVKEVIGLLDYIYDVFLLLGNYIFLWYLLLVLCWCVLCSLKLIKTMESILFCHLFIPWRKTKSLCLLSKEAIYSNFYYSVIKNYLNFLYVFILVSIG